MDRRIIAAMQLMLIFPAVLFLTAVVARHLQPLQYELAHTAQAIVTWYSLRIWTLWVLLIGLPFAALLNGCVVLLRHSTEGTAERRATKPPFATIRTQLSTQVVTASTLVAGLILVVVALHMLANWLASDWRSHVVSPPYPSSIHQTCRRSETECWLFPPGRGRGRRGAGLGESLQWRQRPSATCAGREASS